MKRFIATMVFLTAAVGLAAQTNERPCRRSDTPWRYYRIQSVTRVKGEIQALHQRNCYHGHRFLLLEIRTPGGELFTVETAPHSFLSFRFRTGEFIEVTGSLLPRGESHPLIIARRIRYKGETREFRDPNGFPLWHGIRGKIRRQGRKGK